MGDKIKHILIDVIIIFVFPAALFYLYLTFRSDGGGLLQSEQPGAELVTEGAKFLQKLKELETLELDSTVFDSATYKSLVDTTIPPPTEAHGRPHPFILPSGAPAAQTAAAGKSVPPKR